MWACVRGARSTVGGEGGGSCRTAGAVVLVNAVIVLGVENGDDWVLMASGRGAALDVAASSGGAI